jgi:DnaJ-class molecular chaperone
MLQVPRFFPPNDFSLPHQLHDDSHLIESFDSHIAPSSASQQDPYTLLGVKKTASQGEIKKAYYQV